MRPRRLAGVGAIVGVLFSTLPVAPATAHPHGNWGSAYRSVDGGRIWSDLNRHHPVGTVYDVSAPHPPRIWEATDQGLLRTDNLGDTWERVGPRALGEVLRVVSEDPADGSVLVGGPAGLFRAPADLSRWDRILSAEPVSLTRDGQKLLVRTSGGWYHSDDGGRTFTDGTAGLSTVNERLASLARRPGLQGRQVLTFARAGEVSVAGTEDGAYVSSGNGPYQRISGSEGLMVPVALAGPRTDRDGILLGTSRGLLRFRPDQPDGLRPEPDIPPFLAIGAVEIPAERPDELYIATSVTPYPAPPPLVDADADAEGPDIAALAALTAGLAAVGAALIIRVRRRGRTVKSR